MNFYYSSADVQIQMQTFQNCAQLFGFKIDDGVEVVILKRMFSKRCIYYIYIDNRIMYAPKVQHPTPEISI